MDPESFADNLSKEWASLPYRTGKSFFVNRVLLDQKKGGFQVGPTINPCTKGLWLWKKTIQS